MKSPFVDQQACNVSVEKNKGTTLIHQGGVPLGAAASRATIRSCRRSHNDMVPSMLLVRKTSLQGSCWEECPFSTGSVTGEDRWLSITGSSRPPFIVPLGDSSPKRDSRELLLPSEPRRRSSYTGGAGALGGEGAGYSGTVALGRNRIEDI
jgi:hypothetical protein